MNQTYLTSEQIIELKKSVTDDLFELPNVVGVDVGYKETGGTLTEQLTIRVHVSQKDTGLSESDRVPERIEGIPTDVIVGDYGYQADFILRSEIERIDEVQYQTVRGGTTLSVLDARGHAHSGTLGMVVKDGKTGKPLALTNAHVTGGELSEGETCFHPYPWTDNGRLGRVTNAVRDGNVDAAVCRIEQHPVSYEIAEIGAIRGSSNAIVTGMSVRKRGRQTRLTHGTVEGVHGSFKMSDGVVFKDVITIRPLNSSDFSVMGDSGAVIVNEQNQVVAQLFAGFDSDRFGQTHVSGRSLAVPIWKVIRALNIEIPNSRPVAPSRPTTTVSNRPVLRLGARGPQVGVLQSLLSSNKFPVSVDGIFGLRTRYAVMIFQLENKLQPDGIVGGETWNRLTAVA